MANSNDLAAPATRRLRVFTLDPSLATQLKHMDVSVAELRVRWEELLTAGPVGEYVQVVDIDPASQRFYAPVDLNHSTILAENGLSPSLGNPQFHQQMVYAVTMKTIENFERILGRRMLWRERYRDENGLRIENTDDRFVPRLSIYPHALRQQNAYYSPSKLALLFGYFNASTNDTLAELPGGLVFTCLSHDIIAHETTHAILDGMNRRLLDSVSNIDMLAFHEAFADIVAIFQHFTLPDLLHSQIQANRGDLQQDGLLAQLAVQFARSTGQGEALRNALGVFDDHGHRLPPDPSELARTYEPHARGAILVAAVFDAFIRIYERRVADLRRIATKGTGILPDGDIHPDLAKRFADEATRSAQRVLSICVRAIDYVPPVDLTFGDYFRALVTADKDLYPNDSGGYRVAFIEAFRSRGIYPLDVYSLSEDSLCWSNFKRPISDSSPLTYFTPPSKLLRSMADIFQTDSGLGELADLLVPETDEEDEKAETPRTLAMTSRHEEMQSVADEILNNFRIGNADAAVNKLLETIWIGQPDNMSTTTTTELSNFTASSSAIRDIRRATYISERLFKRFLHNWIQERFRTWQLPEDPASVAEAVHWIASTFGIDVRSYLKSRYDVTAVNAPMTASSKFPPIEVFAIKPTVRLREDGRTKTELLITITQRVKVTLTDEHGEPIRNDCDEPNPENQDRTLSFYHRGGCTLILDPESAKIKYSITKNILSKRRLERAMNFFRQAVAMAGPKAVEHYGLTAQAQKRRRKHESLVGVHCVEDHSRGY
ncbi:hypothetical protein AB1L30_13795 [Bremerella sp. JC817]|uniref:hypothetical protein n=1 Tax=Bremerella sp. JC817 TaxID=3231756 RepID=UPI003457EE5E